MKKLAVILFAGALVFGFGASAMAAQALFYTQMGETQPPPEKVLEVYGSVRLMTYIQSFDKENASATARRFDDTDLVWDLDDSSSRFGVRFKSGDVGANVEIRPRDRQVPITGALADTSRDLLRHWYGTWDFGPGTLVVGQTWDPSFHPICNECLLGGGGVLDGYGDFGGSVRRPGLQVWFPLKAVNGMFKFAALRMNTDATVPIAGFGAAPFGVDTDTKLPMLEASLAMSYGPLDFMVRGGYNTYDVVNNFDDNDVSIDSWFGALDVTFSSGPFYLRGLGYIAQNLWTYGTGAPPVNWNFQPMAFIGTDVEDVDHWGWFGVAGFRFNDMVSIEAGYGQRKSKQDNPLTGFEASVKPSAFVFFLPINVAKGFILTPEILLTDEGDATSGTTGLTTDRGNRQYYGIYWRIDF